MELNTGSESQAVEFENACDHYVFRPRRIVPFEEAGHIYSYDREIRPDTPMAVTNSNHGVPTTSGRKGFWRYNCKTLAESIRDHAKVYLIFSVQHLRVFLLIRLCLRLYGLPSWPKKVINNQWLHEMRILFLNLADVPVHSLVQENLLSNSKVEFIDHGHYNRSTSRSSSPRDPLPTTAVAPEGHQ